MFDLRWILHVPGAISVHGSVSPSKPRTRALWSGAEFSADRFTAPLAFTEFRVLFLFLMNEGLELARHFQISFFFFTFTLASFYFIFLFFYFLLYLI